MLKKPKIGWVGTIALLVAAAIPLYFIVGIAMLVWQIRAYETASQQLAESLRERYPKLDIRNSSGAEHIGLRVIGASDEIVEGEIMDWLRAESEKRRLPPMSLQLEHRGQFWLDDTSRGKVWRKND